MLKLNHKKNSQGVVDGYIYFDGEKLEEKNKIKEIIQNNKLQLDSSSLQMLLQCGVQYPGRTIYKDVFSYSPGVNFAIEESKLELDYSFPFPESKRDDKCIPPSNEDILEALFNSLEQSRIEGKDTFLFHSAGKDSNSIALAIAEAGFQKDVTLICQESKGKHDESQISKKIANKLGFNHITLKESQGVMGESILLDYFEKLPSPVIDNVGLAFPYYLQQIPDLANSNIIDGGGNDIYMMTPPSGREVILNLLSCNMSSLFWLQEYLSSNSLMSKIVRSAPEQYGMSGLSFGDIKKITSNTTSCSYYWDQHYKENRYNRDKTEIKTEYLCAHVAASQHIAKMQNFCEAIDSNLVLPFTNDSVVSLFSSLSYDKLFEGNRNKTILRDMLKTKLGLDSDKVGKMPWTYNSQRIVKENKPFVISQISKSNLWNKHVDSFVKSMYSKDSKYSISAVYRLFLLSIWHNNFKF